MQPTTQNPQTAPGQLFPQSDAPQTANAATVLEDGNQTIQVPTEPAAARPTTPTPAHNHLPVIVLVVVLILWIWRLLGVRRSDAATVVSEIVIDKENTVAASATPKRPKQRPKRSKSKRKHR